MRDLIAALTASVDPAAVMHRIVEQMWLVSPKAEGAAVSLLTEDGTFFVVSACGLVESLLNTTFPREGTFAGAAISTGLPQVSPDAPRDCSLIDDVRRIGVRLGVRSLVVIPLLHDDDAIGVLSMSAAGPACFDDRDIAAMQATGRFISALISSHTELSSLLDDFLTNPCLLDQDSAARFLASVLLPEAARDDQLNEVLDDVLAEPSNLGTVFQPIVELHTGRAVGFEGLSRFPRHPERSPWQWFDLARRLDRSLPLELRALQRVLSEAERLPSHCFTAVNLSPLTAADPQVQAVLMAHPRTLVLEITEHERFPDTLADSLIPLRDSGIRLAVDDAGAGYASFTQLLRLRPDIIKIDATLTQGIEDDPVKRALAAAIVELAAELDATTVAEAIETPRQQDALQRLGIHLGQGYHIGRPKPLPEPWTDPWER